MAQLDPNIKALLIQQQEHNQSLLEQQAGRDAALINSKKEQLVYSEKREKEAEKRRWVDAEAKKIDSCDGNTSKAVRVWIKDINAAARRVLVNTDKDEFVNRPLQH